MLVCSLNHLEVKISAGVRLLFPVAGTSMFYWVMIWSALLLDGRHRLSWKITLPSNLTVVFAPLWILALPSHFAPEIYSSKFLCFLLLLRWWNLVECTTLVSAATDFLNCYSLNLWVWSCQSLRGFQVDWYLWVLYSLPSFLWVSRTVVIKVWSWLSFLNSVFFILGGSCTNALILTNQDTNKIQISKYYYFFNV